MINLKTLPFLLCFLFFVPCLQAQQVLLPVKENTVVKEFLKSHPGIDRAYGNVPQGITNAGNDTLPFFEDFTTSRVLPDTNKWMDRSVFINNGFAINPPSYNVATFDGLDKEGNAYKLTTGLTFGGADTLTSRPLNLKNYTRKDSVYLSFFFQRQGQGDQPQTEDTLYLQFLNTNGFWNTVWKKEGGVNDNNFLQVLLKIDSSLYFHDQFQFRFTNLANLTGNLNHWNVDYIFMNRGRNAKDTYYRDATISSTPTSVLKRYASLPWNQFKANPAKEKSDSVHFVVSFLDTIVKANCDSRIIAFNRANNNLIYNYKVSTAVNVSLKNNDTAIFEKLPQLDTCTVYNNDTSIIDLIYTNKFTGETYNAFINNDTFKTKQLFANYYAYDDGSAEAGYGIDFGPGKVALGFETNVADTLRAIDIYFNQSLTSNANISFSLTIWSEITTPGLPANNDKILHYQTITVPEHTYSYRDGMGGFTRFKLDTVRYLPAGKFYIGWRQNSNFMLNVGFDKNYPESFGKAYNPMLFYNTDGTWRVSGFPGTVMMRPVVGKSLEPATGMAPKQTTRAVKVYPNPAHSLLYINLPEQTEGTIQVMDMQGRVILSKNIDGPVLNISELPAGMYILQLQNNLTQQHYTTKFTIE